MDYVREHIKRYWGMVYRRTLGVSLITFSVVFALGLTFTALTRTLAVTSFVSYIIFWGILLLIAISVLLSSFYAAHVSSIKLMKEKEHRNHSKNMGKWMILIVVGVLLFLVPLLFFGSYIEPMLLLFTLGGVFMVLYLTIRVLFKHSYNELAIGAIIFWLMFIIGLSILAGTTFNILAKSAFSFYFTEMIITIVTGFIGLAFIFNYAKESSREFASYVEKIEAQEKRARRR